MRKKARSAVEDLRGASRLAVDATKGVSALIEAMHRTIAGGPAVLGKPLEGPARLLTGPVYGTIRGVAQLVGASMDRALGQLAPLLGDRAPGPEREALLAALNGVLGDYLRETANPLAVRMRLRHGGQPLALRPRALRAAFPAATGKLLVLVHGSSMNDLQWNRDGHDHGAALARDLGLTPVYVHYNSGLHVSTNGRELARLLERLCTAWPRRLRDVVLVGHSMGGLLARSACHAAEVGPLRWRKRLRALVCLGTPHHGAPLERGGNWLHAVLGLSRHSEPFARLARIRSAGVTDLRFGFVLDEHWRGRDRFALDGDRRTPLPLPAGVQCYAVAGTTAKGPGARRLPGDGLVPVDSALGRHQRPELSLGFPEDHQSIAWDTGHVELLGRPRVYATMRRWLSSG
jgi:hypothetical protein